MSAQSAHKDLLRRMRLLVTWYEDLESDDSEATEYATLVSLRVILQNLSAKDRKHFTTILESDPTDAKTFAEEKIPDLSQKIATAISEGLIKAMDGKENNDEQRT